MKHQQFLEITVNSKDIQWYKNKGYTIPTEKVQLWCTNKKTGERVKNGIGERVKRGTKITVKVEDLPPASNQKIEWICEHCNKKQSTTYYAFLRKKSNLCRSCFNTTQRNLDSQDYWVQELISRDEQAKCFISGETDKRFLVLHHLNSKSGGGKNERQNYVVLTANWHTAFHRWMGGFNKPCTHNDFTKFLKHQTIKE